MAASMPTFNIWIPKDIMSALIRAPHTSRLGSQAAEEDQRCKYFAVRIYIDKQLK